MAGSLWNTGDHLLRLTNIDGQFAEKWFTVDTPLMSNVTDAAGVADTVAASVSPVAVIVTGRNLRSGSTSQWLPSGGTDPTLIDAAQLSVVSATQATVNVYSWRGEGERRPHDFVAARNPCEPSGHRHVTNGWRIRS